MDSGPSDIMLQYISPAAVNSEQTERGPPVGSVGSDRRCCSEDTLENWTLYLNNELTTLGFQCILKQSEAAEAERHPADAVDIVQLVSCTYELLLQHRADVRARDVMKDQLQRCQSDKEQLAVARDRLKSDLAAVEHELDSAVQQHRRLKDQLKAVNEKFQSERQELKKVRSIMVQRSVQYSHEVKKWERESSKLKDKLHQVLSDRSQERKIGMDMLNVLHREHGKRRMWKTGTKHEDDMYRMVIVNLEERQKELVEENVSLRDSLVSMQQELVSLLNGNKLHQVGPESVDEPVADMVPLAQFQMPYELVREGIEASLKEKWNQLKDHVSHLEKIRASHSRESRRAADVQMLQTKLDEYQRTIEQQEQLLKEQLQRQLEGSKCPRSVVESVTSPVPKRSPRAGLTGLTPAGTDSASTVNVHVRVNPSELSKMKEQRLPLTLDTEAMHGYESNKSSMEIDGGMYSSICPHLKDDIRLDFAVGSVSRSSSDQKAD